MDVKTSIPPSAAETAPCDLVSEADLEGQLARLVAEVTDPRAGLFGPHSKIWEVNREAVLFLASGRAALLQLAHPYVAEAIHQHSDVTTHPLRRFHRTFANVFDMVFGQLDDAFRAARLVHRVHTKIGGQLSQPVGAYPAGSRYQANDRSALLWVHATLWESSVTLFERMIRPLSPAEKEAYYGETRRFAALFGLRDHDLPADWPAFESYNEEMWSSDRLAVGEHASKIASSLFQPPRRGLGPLMRWMRVITAGLLPEPVRRGFGLAYGQGERRICEHSLHLLRRSRSYWPRRLRLVPVYVTAERRLSGRTGRDRLGEMLTRLYVGRAGRRRGPG